MKRKTIKAVLKKKHKAWADSITDKKVKNLVAKNTIITGGCIASMLMGEPVNDYDIYFTDKDTVKTVAEYYAEIFNKDNNATAYVIDGAFSTEDQVIEQGGERLWKSVMFSNMTEDRIKMVVDGNGAVNGEAMDAFDDADQVPASMLEPELLEDKNTTKPKYRPVFISSNAITLSDDVQLIIRFYGDAKQIHENFDFVHCMNYWTSEKGDLVTNVDSLEAIMSKTLVYNGSKYPLASIIRTRKFIKRGWNINAGQYLKMCFQLSELNLRNIEVLEEQLIGVDTLYFTSLINAIKSKMIKDKEFIITEGYLTSIIDKIF